MRIGAVVQLPIFSPSTLKAFAGALMLEQRAGLKNSRDGWALSVVYESDFWQDRRGRSRVVTPDIHVAIVFLTLK
jgi:hypothetical protein